MTKHWCRAAVTTLMVASTSARRCCRLNLGTTRRAMTPASSAESSPTASRPYQRAPEVPLSTTCPMKPSSWSRAITGAVAEASTRWTRSNVPRRSTSARVTPTSSSKRANTGASREPQPRPGAALQVSPFRRRIISVAIDAIVAPLAFDCPLHAGSMTNRRNERALPGRRGRSRLVPGEHPLPGSVPREDQLPGISEPRGGRRVRKGLGARARPESDGLDLRIRVRRAVRDGLPAQRGR